MLFALLLQAAAPATAPSPPPQRFSILADPCARIQRDGRDVVVCGADPAATQRLPYPEEIVPDHGVPSNPLVNGVGALAAENTPCAVRLEGCQVGVGPPVYEIVSGIVHAVGNARASRRESRARAADGDRRQPIDLTARGPAGHLEP